MLPVLARLGPLSIGTHDFFTILGLLTGFALYYRALPRERILGGPIALVSVAAILGGALGARLITSWEVLGDVQQAGLPLTYVLTPAPAPRCAAAPHRGPSARRGRRRMLRP